jgi:branched-chain amino acid transport system substrate-binding protein
MGAGADGRVYMVSYAHANLPGDFSRLVVDYKKKFNDDFYTGAVYHAYTMLSQAFVKAKSTDPVKVAAVLEGMKFKSFNGEVEMRKTDHQLQQGLFISKWEKAGGKYPLDSENTGYTFVPVKYYEPYVASTPTSCQMKRPS